MVKLALLMITLGGVGGAIGGLTGKKLGSGGVISGGLVVGWLLVVAAGFLASRWGWITREQRPWTILGGVAGLALAVMVLLSTLTSPIGPYASLLLIGIGGALGAFAGRSDRAKA